MPSPPTVSICIPTYNGQAYLAECLDSALAQTYPDFEVVITDDCSRDGTVALAQDYAACDSRVRVIQYYQNSGGGGAGNYNRCLDQARGTWIKYLFQDDLLAPTCLERMLEAAAGSTRFVVCGRDFLFDGEADEVLRDKYLRAPNIHRLFGHGHIATDDLCDAMVAHWQANIIGEPVACLVHRKCFERYGHFRQDLVNTADLECWLRIASHEGVTVVDEPLAVFRVHSGSTSADNRNNKRLRVQLEEVLLSLALAEAPAFEQLRAAAARSGLDPWTMIVREARGARWVAIDYRERLGDPSLMEQCEAFLQAYPTVAKALHQADADQAADGPSPWTRLKSRLTSWLGNA